MKGWDVIGWREEGKMTGNLELWKDSKGSSQNWVAFLASLVGYIRVQFMAIIGP